jgi:hypothetical protein
MRSVGVLTADDVTGPYSFVAPCFKPDGQDSYPVSYTSNNVSRSVSRVQLPLSGHSVCASARPTAAVAGWVRRLPTWWRAPSWRRRPP